MGILTCGHCGETIGNHVQSHVCRQSNQPCKSDPASTRSINTCEVKKTIEERPETIEDALLKLQLCQSNNAVLRTILNQLYSLTYRIAKSPTTVFSFSEWRTTMLKVDAVLS